MKSILSLLFVLSLTSGAHAKCFSFAQGEGGPTSLGKVSFATEKATYEASYFCLVKVSGFAGDYTTLELGDKDGALLQVSVEDVVGKCGPREYCHTLTGLSGNALGKNLTEAAAKSIQVMISTKRKNDKELFSGTFTDRSQRLMFSVTEIKIK